MISRRRFVKRSALAVTAASLMPNMIFANAAPRVVGLQLYSLRETIGNDVAGTLKKVAGIGFKEVETYGYSPENGFWGLSVSEFKKLLDQNGLTTPSGHYSVDPFLAINGSDDDFKYLIDVAHELGQKYIVIPSLGDDLRTSIADYERLADKMNAAGKLCQEADLKLAYHNHAFEFKDYDGQNGYEILLNDTQKELVDFEMDVYWIVRAGQDPVSLFEANPGRFPLLHIKDMDKDDPELNAGIGAGTIDFVKIAKDFDVAGAKHLIIEQENFAMDPYKSLTKSYAYIKQNLMNG